MYNRDLIQSMPNYAVEALLRINVMNKKPQELTITDDSTSSAQWHQEVFFKVFGYKGGLIPQHVLSWIWGQRV